MTFSLSLCSRDFLRVVNLQNSLQLEEPHPERSRGPLASLERSAVIYWGGESDADAVRGSSEAAPQVSIAGGCWGSV